MSISCEFKAEEEIEDSIRQQHFVKTFLIWQISLWWDFSRKKKRCDCGKTPLGIKKSVKETWCFHQKEEKQSQVKSILSRCCFLFPAWTHDCMEERAFHSNHEKNSVAMMNLVGLINPRVKTLVWRSELLIEKNTTVCSILYGLFWSILFIHGTSKNITCLIPKTFAPKGLHI